MLLKNVRTPEQMLDYIIADLTTYRCIYNQNSRRYGFFTEVIGELHLIKEEYNRQTQQEEEND